MFESKAFANAVRSTMEVMAVAVILGLIGCHTVPVAPVAVQIAPPGTVRVLGAVELPQAVTIPPQGLTLAGALELAGGLVLDAPPPPTVTAPNVQPEAVFNVVVQPVLNDTASIPRVGRNTLFVAQVNNVLFFRAFDSNGRRFLDLNENQLRRRQISVPPDFRATLLEYIAAGRELTEAEKRDVVEQVKTIGENVPIRRELWNATPARTTALSVQDTPSPDKYLIGLRRIVDGVPNTTFFAVPLVLRYQAGGIPLQDGDQVRVVSVNSTSLNKFDPRLDPGSGDPPAQVTAYVGNLSDNTVLNLAPGETGQPYSPIINRFARVVDLNDFSTMVSLTRVNPIDGGTETFVIPNQSDETGANPFPLYTTELVNSMKVQNGDILGLTTLGQVPAIAIPTITAATNSLLEVLQDSQAAASHESRLHRSLNSLRRGQIPTTAPLAPLPTVPPLPRSLSIPSNGGIAERLREHQAKKHNAYAPMIVGSVPAINLPAAEVIQAVPPSR